MFEWIPLGFYSIARATRLRRQLWNTTPADARINAEARDVMPLAGEAAEGDDEG